MFLGYTKYDMELYYAIKIYVRARSFKRGLWDHELCCQKQLQTQSLFILTDSVQAPFISSPRIYKRSPRQLFVHIPILNGHVYAECFCSGFELFWRWFRQISLRQKLAESKPSAWTYVFITNTRNTIWICR